MPKSKLLNEFKTFALKGNMIDLAIGIIIGGSFSALVNSMVNDIIMPVVGFLTGGIDFSNKFVQLSGTQQATLAAAKATGATIAYGHFVTLAINFIIIAWILFLAVKKIAGIGQYFFPAVLAGVPFENSDFLTQMTGFRTRIEDLRIAKSSQVKTKKLGGNLGYEVM